MVAEFLHTGLKTRVKAVFFFGVVFLLGYLIFFYRDQVIVAFKDHYSAIIYATAIVVVSLSLQAYNFLQLLDTDRKIPFVRAVSTWAIANLANYLGPFQPGLAVRIGFFRSMGIPVATTVKATLRQLMLSVWIASGLTIVGLLDSNPVIKLFSVGGVAAFLLMPFVLRLLRMYFSVSVSEYMIMRLVRKVLNLGKIGMPVYRLWPFVAQYLLMALCFFAVYQAFGLYMQPHEYILLAVVFALSSLFSVTPNNLGVQELLIGYVAHQLGGLSGGDALGVALIFRVAHFFACMILIGLAYSLDSRKKPVY